jgi:hypothetical protein
MIIAVTPIVHTYRQNPYTIIITESHFRDSIVSLPVRLILVDLIMSIVVLIRRVY